MVALVAQFGCVVIVTIENMPIHYHYSRSAMPAMLKHHFDIAFLSPQQISGHFLLDSGLYTRVIHPCFIFVAYVNPVSLLF